MLASALLKKMALALTVSQIFTRPQVQTHFDPTSDYKQVVEIMNDGCKHFQAVGVKYMPELKDMTPEDIEQMLTAFSKMGNDSGQLLSAYRLFCTGKAGDDAPAMVSEIVAYYNEAAKDLPDPNKLKKLDLPESSVVMDRDGKPFTEVYQDDNRRKWVSLKDIPKVVQDAFVAAEDKNFFSHHGVDDQGVLRAAKNNAGKEGGHQEGASTLTQQVVKNLLTGDAPTFDRKIKEMILATQIEKVDPQTHQPILTKDQILELYLNFVFLGRASWGVEMAARSYFGKSIKDVKSPVEAAFLASLPKGPRYYGPDSGNPERMNERIAYVLHNMNLDQEKANIPKLQFSSYQSPRARGGFYFITEMVNLVKAQFNVDPTHDSTTIRSTILPGLQMATEKAVQDGLAKYEIDRKRAKFSGAEKNLTEEVEKLNASDKTDKSKPTWQTALNQAYLPLYDVRWEPAIVLGADKKTGIQVGLKDGRVLPLRPWDGSRLPQLNYNDVVMTVLHETKRGAYAELRFRPQVQGAAMVVENSTGRILALQGGFSYPLNQFDRAIRATRQPGSTMKPVTYLEVLQSGLQPNTLVMDQPVSLQVSENKWWTPKNFDRNQVPRETTIRRGLENSLNQVTLEMLNQIVRDNGQPGANQRASLDRVLNTIRECGISPNPENNFSTVLGTMEVSMLGMATCYATIANNGKRPALHLIDSVETKNGAIPLQYEAPKQISPDVGDEVSFFQLRTLLQGVIERGTAVAVGNRLQDLVPRGKISDYIAGKTGTSQKKDPRTGVSLGANDAWFMGFTNDLTIAVWVGYDAGRTLGQDSRATGADVAAPIFESILRASTTYFPLRPFPTIQERGLSNKLVRVVTQKETGQVVEVDPRQGLPDGYINEYLRVVNNQVADTWQDIVRFNPNYGSFSVGSGESDDDGDYQMPGDDYYSRQREQYRRQQQQQQPFGSFIGGLFGPLQQGQSQQRGQGYYGQEQGGYMDAPSEDPRQHRRPMRIDPDYYNGGGGGYYQNYR